ncbi:MAG: leucine-rich repeat domain-containing protein [Ruminococcus sp.]|nr:leucine-rich repeat domain-containing protein [Ruminococcus sp.]
MKRQLISSVLALSLALGGAAALPEGVFTSDSSSITAASAANYNGFTYTTSSSGEVAITGYTGSDTTITIPSEIDSKPVTKIDSNAFYKSSVTNVTLPDTLTFIGANAFDSSRVTSIIIPVGVTEISTYAFAQCSSLTSIIIPKTVTKMGDWVFYHSSNVTIRCYEDSYAKQYALDNNLRYAIIEHEHSHTSKVTKEADCTNKGVMSYYCPVSGDSYTEEIPTNDKHNFVTTINKQATCAEDGLKTLMCSLCGQSHTEVIPMTKNHTYVGKITKAATCTQDGVKTYTCSVCSDSYTEAVKKTGHKYLAKVVAPTYDAQGYTEHTCSVCGDSYKDNYKDKLVRTSIAKAKVTVSDKAYTGKAQKPAPTVKENGVTLTKGTDYTVTYKNNVKVGKATLTVKGKGAYEGTVSKTFKINPKKTSVSKLTSPKTKRLKVTYKKVSGVTGYQVTYSTSKNFTKSTTKTVTVKGTSKTVKSLKKGKTYYVKVRANKTVGSTKYYGAYSAVKKVKIK